MLDGIEVEEDFTDSFVTLVTFVVEKVDSCVAEDVPWDVEDVCGLVIETFDVVTSLPFVVVVILGTTVV